MTDDSAEVLSPIEDTDPDYDEVNDVPDEDAPVDLPEATDDPEPMQAGAQ